MDFAGAGLWEMGGISARPPCDEANLCYLGETAVQGESPDVGVVRGEDVCDKPRY